MTIFCVGTALVIGFLAYCHCLLFVVDSLDMQLLLGYRAVTLDSLHVLPCVSGRHPHLGGLRFLLQVPLSLCLLFVLFGNFLRFILHDV